MPSPFPGMDPFIESSEWEDFHSRFITAISDAIVPAVRPDYLVRTERRVYVEHSYEASRSLRPDLTIVSWEATNVGIPETVPPGCLRYS